MKPTFNQIAAVVVSIICIIILTAMHYHPVVNNDAPLDAIKGALGLAVFYLFGSTSGSQAKDDVISKAQDALANSTPTTKNS